MKRTPLPLWFGLAVLGTLLAADPVALDFSRSAAAAGAGGFDARVGLEITPDMVALAEGKLVLRARSEPWGARTGTFLDKDIGALGARWTLDTCLVFSSPLLEPHAGLHVGTPEASVRRLVGRPGQPYDLRLLGPAGEKLTASPAGSRDGQPLWLRLLRSGTRIWGLYSLAGLDPGGQVHEHVVVGSDDLHFHHSWTILLPRDPRKQLRGSSTRGR